MQWSPEWNRAVSFHPQMHSLRSAEWKVRTQHQQIHCVTHRDGQPQRLYNLHSNIIFSHFPICGEMPSTRETAMTQSMERNAQQTLANSFSPPQTHIESLSLSLSESRLGLLSFENLAASDCHVIDKSGGSDLPRVQLKRTLCPEMSKREREKENSLESHSISVMCDLSYHHCRSAPSSSVAQSVGSFV